MKIIKSTFFLILFLINYNSISQNRAPSIYLDYNKDIYQGDIIVNTLRVASPVPLYTYYNAMVFGGSNGDGGGYCGMQSSPQGKNYIFSLWDPNTVNKEITADYIGDGTKVQKFGGEGTGLQSFNYKISWEPNEWYSFVTRIWNIDNNSYYGFWVFDHKNKIWHHIVTMNYPVKNLKFTSRTCAFIEDWMGNGSEVREIHRKNGWKRKTNSEWFALTEGTVSRVYPDAGCSNYIENYDGGIIDDYFFIKSGGTTSTNNKSGTTLKLEANKKSPDFQPCEIGGLISNLYNDSLEIQWVVDSTKSPQYSYTIEIYNNPEFIGEPFLYYKKIKPQERKSKIKITNNKNYLKFYITDIFDNKSNILIDTINILNDIIEEQITQEEKIENGLIAWYPFNGNTNDESLNFNSGKNYNTKLTYDRYGKENSAYEFNGISSYIDIKSSESLNTKNMSAISFCGWFLSDDINGGFIIRHGTTGYGGGIGEEIWFDDNKLYVQNWNKNNGGNFSAWSDPITIKQWHFFVIMFDFDNNLEYFYLDNKLIGSYSYTLYKSEYPILNIGRNTNGTSYFKGKIDDIRIYNKILSEDIIGKLYDNYIQTQTTTSIDEIKNTKLDFYPNPATTHINIDSNMKTVEIYSVSGAKQFIINDNFGKIDVSNLKSGMYIIKAENYDGELFSNKFIKQ